MFKGLYPLLPNDKCKFLAIDFDDFSWQKYALLVVDTFNKLELLEKELKGSLPESNTNAVHNIIYNRKASSKSNLVDLPSEINIILSNGIYIDSTLLPNELLNLIKRTAVFSNPEYYTRQAMRLSVYKIPKVINYFDEYGKYLILPRGLLQEVCNVFQENKIKINIQDKRISGINIDTSFKGILYDYQQIAAQAILKHDNGVLWASTAFGKTIVAANIIATRKVSTLIIVNSIQLLEQWEEKLKIFLELDKDSIGRLGGGKKKVAHMLIPRSSEIKSDKDLSMLKLTELYDEIINDNSRNELIINDIIEAFKLGSTPLILTERVEHIKILIII